MMQIKEFDIILDVKTDKVKYRDPVLNRELKNIEVIKGDYKANKLNIYLEDGEKPYDIGENNAEVVFKKYDKTVVVMDSSSDGFEIQDNIIKAILSTNIISIPNRQVRAEVVVRGNNGEVISSKTFQMKVDKYLAEDSIVSEDERGVIDDSLELITEYMPRLELIDLDLLEGYQSAVSDLQDVRIHEGSSKPNDTRFWYDGTDNAEVVRK